MNRSAIKLTKDIHFLKSWLLKDRILTLLYHTPQHKCVVFHHPEYTRKSGSIAWQHCISRCVSPSFPSTCKPHRENQRDEAMNDKVILSQKDPKKNSNLFFSVPIQSMYGIILIVLYVYVRLVYLYRKCMQIYNRPIDPSWGIFGGWETEDFCLNCLPTTSHNELESQP